MSFEQERVHSGCLIITTVKFIPKESFLSSLLGFSLQNETLILDNLFYLFNVNAARLSLPTSQPSEDARLARRQRIVPREEWCMRKKFSIGIERRRCRRWVFSLLWSLLNCKEFHRLRIYSGQETNSTSVLYSGWEINRTSVFAIDLNQRV